MWQSRNKTDLIIEVWEKLDCESVGAEEIEAIEIVVEERYGRSAVDSPMIVARLLADEGAVLRHSEILELFAARRTFSEYDAAFRNILKISNLSEAGATIRRLESLRNNYARKGDDEGLRLVREAGIEAKERAERFATGSNAGADPGMMFAEITEWLRLWLQAPEVFENWIKIRQRSDEYKDRFERKRAIK